MKKFISLVIVAAIIMSVTSITGFAFSDVKTSDDYSSAITHLSNLNFILGYEDGTYKADEVMTRAEFAVVITRMLNASDTSSTMPNIYFDDVKNEYYARGAIAYCASMGYLTGSGDGKFEPEKPIAYNEAVKILINILGYNFFAEAKGGYPSGYLMQAKDIDLTKSVSHVNGSSKVVRGQIAQLVFNALTIPLVTEKSFGEQVNLVTDKDVNLLSKYHKMKIEKGILNANGITAIDTVSCDENSIVVGATSIRKNDNYKSDMLGKSVEVIYKYEDDFLLMSICEVTGKNKEINIENFKVENVNGLKVQHGVGQETFDIIMDAKYKVIKNGEFDFTFELTNLKNLGDGNIVFLDNNNDRKFDIIFINEIENYIVMGKMSSKKIIRDKTDANKFLDLESIDSLQIYDNDKNPMTYDKMEQINILSVIKNTNNVSLYISNSVVSGVVSSKIDEDNRAGFVIDNKKYFQSGTFKTENNITIDPGDEVILYMDYLGNVAYAEKKGYNGYKMGYLTTLSQNLKMEETPKFKIFTRENVIKTFSSTEKIWVNGVRYNVSGETEMQKVRQILNVEKVASNAPYYSQMVVYKLDKEEKITEINQAGLSKTDTNDKFYKFTPDTGLRYSGGAKSFDGVVNCDGNTWLIRTPQGDAKDCTIEDFDVFSLAMFVTDEYTLDFYNYSKYQMIADAIVITSKDRPTPILFDDVLCVLIDKVEALGSDGSIKEKIKFSNNGVIKEEFVSSSVNPKYQELENGDTFRYSLNGAKEVDYIDRYYNYNKDEWSYDKSAVRTELNYFAHSVRIVKGYVADIKNDYLKLSFKKGNFSDTDELMKMESHNLANNYAVSVVKMNGTNVHIEKGTAEDIEIGDVVVIRTRGGGGRDLIVYKSK